MSQIDNVFIIPVLRNDFVENCIKSIYKYTPNINFKVIVIDQTKKGLSDIDGVHLKLRPYRNLGFSKALNEGILHALHWKSTFITCCNDDLVMIHKSWWQGILDTFNMESQNEILVVNPESVKIPLWGYGRPPNEYIEILEYRDTWSDKDYQFLLDGHFDHLTQRYPDLPKTFPLEYHGVCDAFAAWCPVFKRKHFDLIGLWDERFYPGGAEDYDMMTRIYSKGYRGVSTRSSWVWHHWGKSKDQQDEAQLMSLPIENKYRWADTSYLWPREWNEGHNMDVWGKYDSKDGTKKSFKRRSVIATVEI